MNTLRLRTALAAASSLALIVAACGDDSDDDATDRTAEADATDADEPTESDDQGDDGDAVVVRGTDYAFEDLPETVNAGTQLTLVNESDEELHELVAFRIPDDEERSVEELLEVPPEEGEEEDPPALVLVAPPGEEGEAVVGDGTLLEPGRYAIICAIPTGADPEEFMAAAEEATDGPPEVEGGPPHFVHGMFAELTVE